MSKAITITPSLTFGKGSEEAAQFYVSVFSEVFGNKRAGRKFYVRRILEKKKALSFFSEDVRTRSAG